MARDLNEIKNSITSSFISNERVQELYDLTPGNTFDQEFSKVSIENIIFGIVAFSIWSLEKLWDIFKAENEAEMAKQKIHTKQWYRQQALNFQYGFPVIPGTANFDNTGRSESEINDSKIVSQAACVKLISTSGYGILRIKAAKSEGGELVKLSSVELDALRFYFLRYATDAGTQLRVTSTDPDNLKIRLDVYYDPLVLSNNGQRLDGTSDTPVIDGITKFLKSIEFNGALVVSDLTSFLRKIDGVKVVTCRQAASKYGSYSYTTVNISNVGTINEIRVSDSGYMALDLNELEINYMVMPD